MIMTFHFGIDLVAFIKCIVLLHSIIGWVVWADSLKAGMPRGYCDISQDEVITLHLDIASRTYRGIGLVNNTTIGELIASTSNNTNNRTIDPITMNISENEQSNEGNRKSFRRLLTDYNLLQFFNFREYDQDHNIRQRRLSHIKEGMMQNKRKYLSEPAFLITDESNEVNTQQHHRYRRRLQLIDETDLLPETFDVKRCGCRAKIDYKTAFYCPAQYEYCYIPRNTKAFLNDPVEYNGTIITSRKNSTKLTNSRINGGEGTIEYTPTCFSEDLMTTTSKNIWPPIYVTCAIILALVLTTPRGHRVISYIISCFFPRCWTKMEVDFFIRYKPGFARYLIRRYVLSRVRQIERSWNEEQALEEDSNDRTDRTTIVSSTIEYNNVPNVSNEPNRWMAYLSRCYTVNTTPDSFDIALDEHIKTTLIRRRELQRKREEGKKPKEYILKTKIFHNKTSTATDPIKQQTASSSLTNIDDNDDDNDNSCAICCIALHDGDRIGNLSCEHTFHIDCLKVWLNRRNVCPLCLKTDVAVPKPTICLKADADVDIPKSDISNETTDISNETTDISNENTIEI